MNELQPSPKIKVKIKRNCSTLLKPTFSSSMQKNAKSIASIVIKMKDIDLPDYIPEEEPIKK